VRRLTAAASKRLRSAATEKPSEFGKTLLELRPAFGFGSICVVDQRDGDKGQEKPRKSSAASVMPYNTQKTDEVDIG